MPELLQQSDFHPDFHCDCLVIGGGAAGLTSALAANHRQRSVIVMERDGQLSGSTALSSGFIPAAETQSQKSQGISDSLDQFCDDIANKNHHSVDPDYIRLCAQAAQRGWIGCQNIMIFPLSFLMIFFILGIPLIGCTPSLNEQVQH
jgi:fumarate reductase flavoprotein subunit